MGEVALDYALPLSGMLLCSSLGASHYSHQIVLTTLIWECFMSGARDLAFRVCKEKASVIDLVPMGHTTGLCLMMITGF